MVENKEIINQIEIENLKLKIELNEIRKIKDLSFQNRELKEEIDKEKNPFKYKLKSIFNAIMPIKW